MIDKTEERLAVCVILSEGEPVAEVEEVKDIKGLEDIVTEIVDDEL